MPVDRVREAAERHVGDTTVPGLVAAVARGDDLYVEAFGRLGVGRPAVQRDSLFRIASITKPITAAVTMALVATGSSASTSRSTGCCPSWQRGACCGGRMDHWPKRWPRGARSPPATC
jgi:hypothetical protein